MSAVEIDDMPGDGQPEASAIGGGRPTLGAIEFPEDPPDVLRGDARSIVPDADRDGRLLFLQTNGDSSPVGGELHRVVQEVHQHLAELTG